MTTVHEVIVHCQKQIKKEPPPDKLLHYLRRLSRLKITVDDLRETGVGKTVNQLSRLEGDVGQFAGIIVEEWKAMVETQGSEDKEQSESSGSDSEHSDLEIDMNYQPEREPSPPRETTAEQGGDEDEEDEDEEEEEDESDHEGHPAESKNWDTSPRKKETSSYSYDRDRRREEESSEDDEDGEEEDEDSDHKSWENNRIKSEEKPKILHEDKVKVLHEDKVKVLPEDRVKILPEERVKILPEERVKVLHEDKVKILHEDKVKNLYEDKSKKVSPPTPPAPFIKIESEDNERHRDRDKYGSNKEHRNHHSSERSSEKEDRGDKHRDKHKDRHGKEKDRDNRDDRHRHRQDDSSSRHKKHDKERDKDHRRDRDDDRHQSSRSSKHEKSKESRSHKENKEKHKTSEEKSSKKSSSESPKRKARDEKPEKHIETSNNRDSSGGSSSSSHKRKKPDGTPSEDKNKSTKKLKLIESKIESQEIDSTSGLNFSDVLGCLDKTSVISTSSKPKKSAVTSSPIKPPKKNGALESVILQKTIKTENNNYSPKASSSSVADISPKSSKAKVKTEPASYAPPVLTFQPPKPAHVAYPIDLGLEDKPFRTRYEDSLLSLNDKPANDFEALANMMSSRKDRTKVYSGNKTGVVGKIPTLFEMSIRVIQENLDCLGYTGGVPYDILKPALKCATVKQLEEIEFYNSYLQEYTDELWQYHCQRDCKGARPREMESWKDLYYRCHDERQAKLNLLASKVKRNAELAQPVRKAKLAYVEPSSRGPRFNKSKAATIKNGMKTLKHREEKGPNTGGPSYSASAGGKAGQAQNNVTIEEAAIIIPAESRAGSAGGSVSRSYSSSSSQSTTSTAFKKPRKAPLMQKTMKLIKSIYRR